MPHTGSDGTGEDRFPEMNTCFSLGCTALYHDRKASQGGEVGVNLYSDFKWNRVASTEPQGVAGRHAGRSISLSFRDRPGLSQETYGDGAQQTGGLLMRCHIWTRGMGD